MVRPWKAPSSASTRDAPWARPCIRIILKAASLASVPELAKKTREPSGACPISSRRSASVTWVGVAKKFET